MARRRSASNRYRLLGLATVALLLAVACAPAATPGGPPSSLPPAASASSGAVPTNSPDIADPTPPTSLEPSDGLDTAEPAAWRQLGPAGSTPPAREDGTWTVEPGTRAAYLFGGRDGAAVLNDLWVFDLESDRWTELSPVGGPPPARFGHEGVWIDGIGVVVFAGQAGPTTFFDDLWAYDPAVNRWRQLPVEGARPKARYGTCAAAGPDGRLWISHGFTEDGTRFADTQAFDFATGRWSDETPDGQAPVNRCLHGCWWTDDGRLALYAGQTTGVEALGDLWTLAGAATPAAAWSKATGQLPADRNLYAFARHGPVVVVIGGRGLGKSFLEDAFTIDAVTLAIQPLNPDGSGPPGRGGSMLIDDPVGARLVLFGGKTADRSLGDLWALALP